VDTQKPLSDADRRHTVRAHLDLQAIVPSQIWPRMSQRDVPRVAHKSIAMEEFLNGRVKLHCGDCREVLAQLDENSLDACVTDPPYHLTSIVKRFADTSEADNTITSRRVRERSDGYARLVAGGFMGKVWDGGDIAFDPETWRAVYRVLKPGAHLLACGGTRTYHRLVCAIEDAGFEIRDTIMWLYGSGFPKSHDVSKGIDKAAGAEREILGQRKKLESYGPNEVYGDGPDHGGIQLITAPATDAARQWEGWGTALKPACELIVLARKPLSEGTVAANVLKWGTGAININACRVEVAGQRPYHEAWASDQFLCDSCAERVASTTKHSTLETKESIATNNAALTLNAKDVNGLRDTNKPDIGCFDGMKAADTSTNLSTEKFGNERTAQSQTDLNCITSTETRATIASTTCALCGNPITAAITSENMPLGTSGLRQTQDVRVNAGRWPSNVITDGSDEVLAAFPESESVGHHPATRGRGGIGNNGHAGQDGLIERNGDSGSAARFFYQAKADADDRLGSRHPTIKPVDLMQWLVRLVTPKGGVCLDPFAGTGTTGEAAFRESMSAVLIEAEAEYCTDIRRRMALALSGPDERAREAIKAKNLPRDDGPLFSGISEAAE
jgi:DNA modification methylase